MKKVRVIPKLEIKGTNLIKGVQLEGLRVLGDPAEFAYKYSSSGADELIYTDVVASLYGRNSLHDVIKNTAANIFIPLTVGGGIRSQADVGNLLEAGADKVSLNTAALLDKNLVTEIANYFGSQCCVVEVQAKKIGERKWTVLIESGRGSTGVDVLTWVKTVEEMGAGEILLTSVDRDGTRSGLDLELMYEVSRLIQIPVIGSGGVGSPAHAVTALATTDLHSIAISDLLHYGRASIRQVKMAINAAGMDVRL